MDAIGVEFNTSGYRLSIVFYKLIAPEGSFVVSAAQDRGDIIAKFVFFFCIFPVFGTFRETGKITGKKVVFVATAGVSAR